MLVNRESRITQLITTLLTPQFLEVVNESSLHHVPKNSETHFKITIVSAFFETQSLIMRHRNINNLLKNEFESGLHALSIHPYTPARWEAINNKAPSSPNCLDGFKHKIEHPNDN